MSNCEWSVHSIQVSWNARTCIDFEVLEAKIQLDSTTYKTCIEFATELVTCPLCRSDGYSQKWWPGIGETLATWHSPCTIGRAQDPRATPVELSMYRKFLRSKIHRATVTQADLDYEGSLTLPPNLLRAADIQPYESVQVWNVTLGSRLETYAIEGLEGSSDICANGAAAHLIRPQDIIIIATFAFVLDDRSNPIVVQPKVVFVDSHNRMVRVGQEIAGPRRRGVPASAADSCC